MGQKKGKITSDLSEGNSLSEPTGTYVLRRIYFPQKEERRKEKDRGKKINN
jgi:hypothetical protein